MTKYCEDCKHYAVEHPMNPFGAVNIENLEKSLTPRFLCVRTKYQVTKRFPGFGFVNRSKEEKYYDYAECHDERSLLGSCGIKAKYFEEKEGCQTPL